VGDFSTAVESSGISSEKIGVVWIGREREVVIEDECVVRGEVERSDFCETLWEFFVFFEIFEIFEIFAWGEIYAF